MSSESPTRSNVAQKKMYADKLALETRPSSPVGPARSCHRMGGSQSRRAVRRLFIESVCAQLTDSIPRKAAVARLRSHLGKQAPKNRLREQCSSLSVACQGSREVLLQQNAWAPLAIADVREASNWSERRLNGIKCFSVPLWVRFGCGSGADK